MSTLLSNRTRKAVAVVAMTAAAGFSLAACGGSSSAAPAASTPAAHGAPKPVASIDSLQGVHTQIMLDASFVKALGSLKLTPATIGKATLSKSGTLTFPITGGNVTYFKPGTVKPYVIGQIQHEGSGLSLSAGGTTVSLTNFDVDPGISRVYGDVAVNGKPVVGDAFLFQLDGRTLQPLKTSGSDAILQGTKVNLSPVAAGLLNEVFKTKAVPALLPVGVAKITVNTTPAND